MCILLLHYHPTASATTSSDGSSSDVAEGCSCPYVLVAADNRDEFFDRPTLPLHFWPDQPGVLAGRDIMKEELEERGTWMGVSKEGRLAVLTNFRCQASEIRADAATRGKVVSDFLTGNSTPQEYCQSIVGKGHLYNGFSMIAAHIRSASDGVVTYCSNITSGDGIRTLGPGTYGLSNSTLDFPWRKVERGRQRLGELLRDGGLKLSKEELTERLMETLADDSCLHPDPNIPDTGFNQEALLYTSSVFVRPVHLYGKPYGTRTSSVVLMDRAGEVTYTERTLKEPVLPEQSEWITTTFNFQAW